MSASVGDIPGVHLWRQVERPLNGMHLKFKQKMFTNLFLGTLTLVLQRLSCLSSAIATISYKLQLTIYNDHI